MNFLAQHGVSVARAVPSDKGEYVEVIEVEGSSFLVTSFEKASGERLTGQNPDFNIIERWGQLLGRTHALTKTYRPSDPSIRRPEWFEDCYTIKARHLIPASQVRVHAQLDKLLDALRALPQDVNSYGLVHNDAHPGNFLVHNGTITLFDFDDCAYHWFAHDLAMPLYYALWHWRIPEADKPAFTRTFIEHLLTGYRQENMLEPFWLSTIPLFLKFRESDLYSVFHLKWDLANLNEKQAALLETYRHNIENEVPYVDFDFSTLLVS